MKRVFIIVFLCYMACGLLLSADEGKKHTEDSTQAAVSEATEECLDCHATATPGIVADWRKSHHAQETPAQAMKEKKLERRISATTVPEKLLNVSVGCAECHTMNPEKHKDTFEHEGHKVHVVVSPEDCNTCHPVEVEQYSENIMSQAYGNLQDNPVYRDLVDSVNAHKSYEDGKLVRGAVDSETDADSCFYCHGTKVEVTGTREVENDFGEMEFPILSGWPNMGVGRINPDGSKGSCASCHTRHQFSLQMARKPDTCAECHKGPDVPAYAVYKVSKHGNIYSSLRGEWDFHAVPWVPGKHFTAPTCAACHVSLLADSGGEVVAERTHRMNDRLAWRIFGLPYAHPHPKSPDTTVMKNKAGLPLPVELTGEPVAEFLIGKKEMDVRSKRMKNICLQCHSESWVEGQYARTENAIKTTNQMTLAATKIILDAWEKGVAKGLAQKDSIFNETIEKMWIEHWLFYANSTRFASAMMGADYGAFANGRWQMSRNLQEMAEYLELKNSLKYSPKQEKEK